MRAAVVNSPEAAPVCAGVHHVVRKHVVTMNISSLVLSTGVKRPDAIRFYEREGYQRIDGYGPYVGEPLARCFARQLR